MAQIVVFVFSVTLTLTFDLFSIVCHTHCAWCTGISMRSVIRIRPVILGDMPWTHTHTHIHTYTHTHTHTHTPKVILIVSQNARLINIPYTTKTLFYTSVIFSTPLYLFTTLLYLFTTLLYYTPHFSPRLQLAPHLYNFLHTFKTLI